MNNQNYGRLGFNTGLTSSYYESIDEEIGNDLRRIISCQKEYKFEKQLSHEELSQLIINRSNLQYEWSRDEVIELVKNNIVKEAYIEERTLYLTLERKLGTSKKTTITSLEDLRLNFGTKMTHDTSESIKLSNGYRIWTNNILTFSFSNNSLEMINKGGHYVSYSSLSTEEINTVIDVLRNKKVIEFKANTFLKKSIEVLINKGIRVNLKP